MENPATLGATGWTNDEQTYAGDYGYVHGMWGNDVPWVEKNFLLSGTQTNVNISFRYWAVDSWDNETGYMNFNGTQLWAKTVTTYNTAAGWDVYPGTFPAPWSGGTLKRYADVSLTTAFTGTSFTLRFGSTINQAEADEAWGFSALTITDNSIPIPEPCTWVIFSVAIGLLGLLKYRK